MMIRELLVAMLITGGALGAMAQVPVSGGSGVTLQRLVGTPTLVTAVLKDSGARDTNLHVVEVHKDGVIFESADNESVPYLFEDLAMIEVQGDFVPEVSFELDLDRALSPEHQRVVNRATERAREIFNASADNQALRVRAAVILAVAGEKEAVDYLKERAVSNDIETQLAAAGGLYFAGEEVNTDVLDAGFEASSRAARIAATKLSGLVGYRRAISKINLLFQDRSSDFFVPAAHALARLGERESIPRLLETLPQRNPEKAEAAVWALSQLGGQDVIDQLKIRLRDAEGPYRFRIIHVLFNLGDASGKEGMVNLFRNVHNESLDAALKLAVAGNLEAKSDLQQRITQRIDRSNENLIARGEMAATLVKAGDLSAQATIQELLNDESPEVRKAMCEMVTDLGNRRLMNLIQANIENANADVALSAATAAVSLAHKNFRDRLMAWRST